MKESELTEEEVLILIEEISDIKPFNLCFSGGEPLIREELVLKSAEILSSRGIRTNLVTNGCFIDRITARDLKDSGICEIEVSIDGATPETHERLRGVKGSFKKAIRALENLYNVNFPNYEASFVVTKFNVQEFEEIVSLLERIHVPTLLIRPMLIIGTAEKFEDELLPDSYQYREIWKKIVKIKFNGKKNIEIKFYDPLNHLLIFPEKDYFYGIEIQADGSLILSPQLQIKVGNVRNHRLSEYWEAGLPFVWKLPRIRNLLSQINTQADLMTINNKISSYDFDLIDDKQNVRRF